MLNIRQQHIQRMVTPGFPRSPERRALHALAAALLLYCSCLPAATTGDNKGLIEMQDEFAAAPSSPATQGTATVLEVGRQYPGGTRVESASDGVSFAIPAEWMGGLPPDSPAFMLGSETRSGIGMIIMRATASWEDIEQFLNQPQDFGGGVVLTPSAPSTRTGRGYEIDLANALYAGHAIGRIGEAGNGVIVFFGGPAEQAPYYRELAAVTADSVGFGPPRTEAGAGQWQAFLAGKMLKRMSSYYSGSTDGAYVGSSSSQTLHLCSDGSYAYSSRSSMGVDGGGGVSGYNAGDVRQTGRWTVEIIGARVLLTLRGSDGEFTQHTLQVQGEHTYVDGERVYRVPSDRCQ